MRSPRAASPSAMARLAQQAIQSPIGARGTPQQRRLAAGSARSSPALTCTSPGAASPRSPMRRLATENQLNLSPQSQMAIAKSLMALQSPNMKNSPAARNRARVNVETKSPVVNLLGGHRAGHQQETSNSTTPVGKRTRSSKRGKSKKKPETSVNTMIEDAMAHAPVGRSGQSYGQLRKYILANYETCDSPALQMTLRDRIKNAKRADALESPVRESAAPAPRAAAGEKESASAAASSPAVTVSGPMTPAMIARHVAKVAAKANASGSPFFVPNPKPIPTSPAPSYEEILEERTAHLEGAGKRKWTKAKGKSNKEFYISGYQEGVAPVHTAGETTQKVPAPAPESGSPKPPSYSRVLEARVQAHY